MTTEALNPLALMFDVRERLTRIETKMDNSAQRFANIETEQEDHETRIVSLEKAAAQHKTRMAVYATLAGTAVTLLTAFGEKIVNLF